jgi:transposase-like protein
MDAAASPNRTYTPEQRAEALQLVAEVGAAEVGRRLDIPGATIRAWARKAGMAASAPVSEPTRAATDAARRSYAERRTEIARETGAVASDLLDRIRSAGKPSDVRALASGFGTLIDKARGFSTTP